MRTINEIFFFFNCLAIYILNQTKVECQIILFNLIKFNYFLMF